jgi:hypothetical protein
MLSEWLAEPDVHGNSPGYEPYQPSRALSATEGAQSLETLLRVEVLGELVALRAAASAGATELAALRRSAALTAAATASNSHVLRGLRHDLRRCVRHLRLLAERRRALELTHRAAAASSGELTSSLRGLAGLLPPTSLRTRIWLAALATLLLTSKRGRRLLASYLRAWPATTLLVLLALSGGSITALEGFARATRILGEQCAGRIEPPGFSGSAAGWPHVVFAAAALHLGGKAALALSPWASARHAHTHA